MLTSGVRASLCAAVAAVCGLSATPAAARTYDVTRASDPSPGRCKPTDCSLREAIRAANSSAGPDVVVLPSRRPAYRLARPNSPPLSDEDGSLRGDLDVTGKLTIRHPGRGMAAIDGRGVDRVLEIKAPTVIKRVRVTGGDNVSEDPPRATRRTSIAGSGGGIESHSKLTLKRSAVVSNTGADSGGGLSSEPDLTLPDPPPVVLKLIRSKINDNQSIDSTGGGIATYRTRLRIVGSKVVGNRAENAGGGLIAWQSPTRITRTTIAGNRGAAGVGGLYLFESEATVANSTVSGNSTGPGGSAGGIDVSFDANLLLTNSTVAGNRAGHNGGGIAFGLNAGAELRSVTVVGNQADSDGDGNGAGGGLNAVSGVATVVNSLIARNLDDASASDCAGSFTSLGGNLLTTLGGCTGFGPGSGDFLVGNPRLGALRRNGGPTKTIALRKRSPAIGKAVKGEAPARDQRGVRRDRRPDIGAYER